MFSFLREIKLSSNWTSHRNWISGQEEIILPLLFIWKLDPRANCTIVVLNDSQSLSVSDNIMMFRLEVKANIIFLATIHSKTSHHNSGVSLFAAHINCSAVTSFVGVVCFDDVGFIDENISINVSGVDPLATEVLRKTTSSLHHFCFYLKCVRYINKLSNSVANEYSLE